MSDFPLTIRLFGPQSVTIHGHPMPRVRTRSVTWLLALLALRNGRPASRSWIAGTLWPDSAEESALHNLRDDLVRLRKALGPEAFRIQSSTRDTLRLDLSGAFVDALAMEEYARKGDVDSLRAAVDLYTSPLLEGCYEPWAAQDREAYAQTFLSAVETLSDMEAQQGNLRDVLDLLARAADVDPFRDSILRRRMRVMAAIGDVPAAQMLYREHRQRLREEMGIDPDEQTTQLFQQIRERARQPAEPKEDRGIKTIPAPSSLVPSTLPHPITALIGREEAAQEVAGLLAASRLVTLVGVGGIGKTRLAIQIAADLESRFDGGAVFVTLASLSDPALLPAFLASALGLREEASSEAASLLETLIAWLSSRAVLLVMDNCEHLIEAAAAMCQTLLERCPNLRILATSRQRLGLTGEIIWRVPSLLSPDPSEIASQHPQGENPSAFATRYPAVQLFVERAKAARPGFALRIEEEARAVAQICHRLDGIPLAIELAAARVRSLSAQDIQARLEDRFRLLTDGSRAALPRQQTLQAAVDWSWNLLGEAERTLLRQLSVFVGGWTLEAAEQVCAFTSHALSSTSPPTRDEGKQRGEGDVLDLLSSLVDKSLVIYEEAAGIGGGRYRLLETVREYAARRLAEGGEEYAVQCRHRDYFLGLAEEAVAMRKRPEQSVWLARLDAEHDNLRAAFAFCLAEREGAETGLRLASALWWFWWIRGCLSEGRERCAAALSREDAAARTDMRAAALQGAGVLAMHQGDYTEARALHEEALAIRQETGDRQGVATSFHSLANVLMSVGERPVACDLYEQAVKINREIGNRAGELVSLGGLGNAALSQGDAVTARACFEQALAFCREIGDHAAQAIYLASLGEIAYREGDYDGAAGLKQAALAVSREVGHAEWEAGNLMILGKIAGRKGDYARGRALCWQALQIQRRLGLKNQILVSLVTIAFLKFAQQDYGEAVRLYGGCRVWSASLGVPLEEEEEEARLLAAARAALGEETFAAILAEGCALTMEQAIEDALQTTDTRDG